MDYSRLATFDFLFSLGYVTLGASFATMVLTEIVKLIMKGTKAITPETNATKKDIVLSRVGRVIALIAYASFYVVDILLIKKGELVLDVAFFASILSGGALTLCISKGVYTGLRQMSKKRTVFDKLDVAEETIARLEAEIKGSGLVSTATEATADEEIVKGKWTIKGE